MTSMSGRSVNRALLSDQIYSGIRDQILQGELAPGDQVVELDISRNLAVSQAPVREAVKRLVHEGLLIHVPRRGSYVAEVHATDIEAARRIRAIVEEEAGRSVTTSTPPGLVDELHALVDQMAVAAQAEDVQAFRDADVSFHRTVALASGSGFIIAIWRLIEPNLRSWHVLSDPLYEGSRVDMTALHVELVEAIESGDADLAADLFGRHAEGDHWPQ